MTQHEDRFSKLLHKECLGQGIYTEKTKNPYRRGTPDYYYEAPRLMAWMEHKWISKPWTGPVSAEDICKTKSWPSQRRWLIRAHENGRIAKVMVGIGDNKQGYCIPYPFDFDPNTCPLLSIQELRTKLRGYLTHEDGLPTG